MYTNTLNSHPWSKRTFVVLAIVIAMQVLLSCQFAPIVPQDLQFSSSIFKPDDINRRAEKVPFGHLQFITAENGPYRVNIVHIAADGGSVVSNHYHHSRIVLRSWKDLKDADLVFGDEYFLKTSIGEIRYERFSISGMPCFQFHRYFNRSMIDDESRERTIIAGYFCNNAKNPANMTEMAELLQGLRLDGSGSWSSVRKDDTSDLFEPRLPLFEVATFVIVRPDQ